MPKQVFGCRNRGEAFENAVEFVGLRSRMLRPIGTKLRTVNGQKLKESQFVGALANVTSSSNRTSDHIESIGKSRAGRTKQGSQKQGGARSNGGSGFGKTAIREVPTGKDNQPVLDDLADHLGEELTEDTVGLARTGLINPTGILPQLEQEFNLPTGTSDDKNLSEGQKFRGTLVKKMLQPAKANESSLTVCSPSIRGSAK